LIGGQNRCDKETGRFHHLSLSSPGQSARIASHHPPAFYNSLLFMERVFSLPLYVCLFLSLRLFSTAPPAVEISGWNERCIAHPERERASKSTMTQDSTLVIMFHPPTALSRESERASCVTWIQIDDKSNMQLF
jgi:hypothetical protein